MMNWEYCGETGGITLRAGSEMEAMYKKAQIIWIAILAAAFIYLWLPEEMHVHERPVAKELALVIAIAVYAVDALIVTIWLRRKLVARAVAILRTSANDAMAAKRWMAGQIVTMAACLSIVLYGLVLRFLGVNRMVALPFYLVGIAAMIILKPQRIE